jgi:hypothetical protein
MQYTAKIIILLVGSYLKEKNDLLEGRFLRNKEFLGFINRAAGGLLTKDTKPHRKNS